MKTNAQLVATCSVKYFAFACATAAAVAAAAAAAAVHSGAAPLCYNLISGCAHLNVNQCSLMPQNYTVLSAD